MERPGDAAGDGIQLDADEAHVLPAARLMKLPVPQPGSRIGGVVGDAQAGDGLVHGRDDGRRGVEGVEGGALGAVVFLGRQQRLAAPRRGPASRRPCSGR